MASDQLLLFAFIALMMFNILSSLVYMMGVNQVKATIRRTFRKG